MNRSLNLWLPPAVRQRMRPWQESTPPTDSVSGTGRKVGFCTNPHPDSLFDLDDRRDREAYRQKLQDRNKCQVEMMEPFYDEHRRRWVWDFIISPGELRKV